MEKIKPILVKLWSFFKGQFFFIVAVLYLLASLYYLSEEDYLGMFETFGLALMLAIAGFMDRSGKKAADVLGEQSEKLRKEVEKLKLMSQSLIKKKEEAKNEDPKPEGSD